MKNFFSIIAITLFALTLTGCGSKNLEVTCSKDGNKIIINYENNKIAKQYMETTQTYENEQLLNMAYQSTQTTVSAYNAMSGVSAEVTKNDNSITLKVTYDISKMNQDNLDEESINQKPKELIKEAKEDGYTCTTK